MKDIPVTKRVERIRQNYLKALNAPIVPQTQVYEYIRSTTANNTGFTAFGFCALRQRINYIEGWKKYNTVYTTRLRRSYATAHVLERMVPVINDDELIVGLPDYRPLTKKEEKLLAKGNEQMLMSPPYFGRVDHCSLDFEKLIKIGVNGMIKEIEELKFKLDQNIEDDVRKDEFYEGCLVELRALLVLQKKYADYVRKLAIETEGPRAGELHKIADILEKVPEKPADTFREALQSIHFYSFNLWGLYAIGRPDQYLLPYYRSDIEAGIITESEAQELIDCFCLLYTAYIMTSSSIGILVGGRDRQGNAVENELTRAFIMSAQHINLAYPGIALSVTNETSRELMEFSVKQLADGCTHPAFFNDKMIISALKKCGFTEEDSRDWVHSSCVELTPCARSGMWPISPYVNLLQPLLDAIESGKEFKTLDELIEDFAQRLKNHIKWTTQRESRWRLERLRNGAEPLRASCLIHDCIEQGKARDEGAAQYNHIMPNFIGLANVVDSLAVIKYLVFDYNELTLTEFNKILDEDYKCHERLRSRIINQIPHFGHNEPVTDGLAKRVAEIIVKSCEGLTTYHGGKVLPSAFSYNQHEKYGNLTKASPDGRVKGYPFADGSGPIQGRDIKGPTASLLSSTSWDQSPFIGGVVINLKSTKKQMLSQGCDNILTLIKTYMERGGMEIQFSVVDAETLRAAQKDPESYRDLTIRIGGFSDYFVKQSAQLQQEIIDRTEQVF